MRVEHVGLWRNGSVESVLMYVADDADNFRPRLIFAAPAELHAPTEGIFRAKYFARSCFANNGDMVGASRVCVREGTTSQ